MTRHYDVLEVRVNNNQVIHLMDNLFLSNQERDLVFGETSDTPHLTEVEYLSLREKLLNRGWRLVSRQSEYPQNTFIASFELCLMPEHHHGAARELAKMAMEIFTEELMKMGISV